MDEAAFGAVFMLAVFAYVRAWRCERRLNQLVRGLGGESRSDQQQQANTDSLSARGSSPFAPREQRHQP